MGKVKQYIQNIADVLNKPFEEVTDEEFKLDWYHIAQKAYLSNSLDKDRYKCFLPTLTVKALNMISDCYDFIVCIFFFVGFWHNLFSTV